jgi:solute carrier family 25 (mitochondrial phosphate transporter), member 3
MTLSLFPSQESVRQSFGSPLPSSKPSSGPTPFQARSELYGAWSVVEDAKNKAQKLSKEAQAEFDKASSKAQAKAKSGTIELYSRQYYAACVVGGLMACVSRDISLFLWRHVIARRAI